MCPRSGERFQKRPFAMQDPVASQPACVVAATDVTEQTNLELTLASAASRLQRYTSAAQSLHKLQQAHQHDHAAPVHIMSCCQSVGLDGSPYNLPQPCAPPHGPMNEFCSSPGHAIILDKPSLSACQGSAGFGLGHGWHA